MATYVFILMREEEKPILLIFCLWFGETMARFSKINIFSINELEPEEKARCFCQGSSTGPETLGQPHGLLY